MKPLYGQRESPVVKSILIAWGATPHGRIWRVNTGMGWFANGKPARKTDPGAYPVRFGEKGQGDISGIFKGGVRVEIECKSSTGRQSEDQRNFQAMIERYGGVYVVARSIEDVDRALAARGYTRK